MPGRLNEDEARDRLLKAGYLLISGYTTTKAKVNVQCIHCSEEKVAQFENLAAGKSKCPCQNVPHVYTPTRDFVSVRDFIKEKGLGDYIISTTYISPGSNLQVMCFVCKKPYDTTFHRFKNHGHRCKCRKSIGRNSFDIAFVKSYIASNGDELISDRYDDIHTHLDIKCGCCSKSFSKTFHYYYYMDKRCLSCWGETRYSQADINKKIAEGGDKCVGEFQTVNDHLAIKCHKCDDVYYMKPYHYFSGSRCSKCVFWEVGQSQKLRYEDIKEMIETFDEKLISVTYAGYDEPLQIQCHTCTNIYSKSYQQFYQGGRCPVCRDSRSKGEKELARICEKMCWAYETQKRFPQCRNTNTLPFDLYLPQFNILIEFQGQQHFVAIKAMGGQIRFEQQQITDQMKRDFCARHKIPLLEISYKDFNRIVKKNKPQHPKINRPLPKLYIKRRDTITQESHTHDSATQNLSLPSVAMSTPIIDTNEADLDDDDGYHDPKGKEKAI
jgi:Zn finger protein HypA/HybF involved in hydrogenase expression